jgi:hypothetical protein
MMKPFIAILCFALLTGIVFAQEGDGDSFSQPSKKVEKFTGTKTDTFEDSDGDGLNDSRTIEGEKKPPLKGFLDAIINRISTDEQKDKTRERTVTPPKTREKPQPSKKSTRKPSTESETKSNRSNSKSK